MHADDLGAQAEQVADQDAATDARALADRHIERVEFGNGAQQLVSVGRHTEHEIPMEGRDELEPGRLGATAGLLAGRLEILAVLDKLGAECAHGGVLLDRIATGH